MAEARQNKGSKANKASKPQKTDIVVTSMKIAVGCRNFTPVAAEFRW
jgi:hypothetical protein